MVQHLRSVPAAATCVCWNALRVPCTEIYFLFGLFAVAATFLWRHMMFGRSSDLTEIFLGFHTKTILSFTLIVPSTEPFLIWKLSVNSLYTFIFFSKILERTELVAISQALTSTLRQYKPLFSILYVLVVCEMCILGGGKVFQALLKPNVFKKQEFRYIYKQIRRWWRISGSLLWINNPVVEYACCKLLFCDWNNEKAVLF